MPLDSVGRHGDSPPEAGFSQSRRASPAAHQSRPNLPVSRCRSPFAFCRTTAPSEPDTQCCSLQVKIRHSACRTVTARRKPAHSLFRLYSVEKTFSTTPLLPSRTPHVLGLRKPRSHKCRGSHNLAQSFAWLLATHLLPLIFMPCANFHQPQVSPPKPFRDFLRTGTIESMDIQIVLLQHLPEACLECHSSKAFLLLSPASGSGWRVARHTVLRTFFHMQLAANIQNMLILLVVSCSGSSAGR